MGQPLRQELPKVGDFKRFYISSDELEPGDRLLHTNPEIKSPITPGEYLCAIDGVERKLELIQDPDDANALYLRLQINIDQLGYENLTNVLLFTRSMNASGRVVHYSPGPDDTHWLAFGFKLSPPSDTSDLDANAILLKLKVSAMSRHLKDIEDGLPVDIRPINKNRSPRDYFDFD